MNPIALVVIAIAGLIAALVIAYQKSETFRDIVQSVWEAIKVGALFVWENVLKPVFDFIIAGFQKVGEFFVWVWDALIKPAWDALGIGINWVWENVIRPAWEALKIALQAVGDFFSWVWNSIIKPAWDALGVGIDWVWQNVIRPTWDALKIALEAIGNFFREVWDNVIKPAWDALGAGINWVWENVIKKAWDALKSGLEGVKNFFDSTVKTIGELWDKMKDIVKAPVKFVVDTIYNQGIVKAWNGIAGFIGMDDKKLGEISTEGWAKGGIPQKKAGGFPFQAETFGVNSGYSPGRDDRLVAVGGGEAILRPEATRALGASWVNGVNANARNGGTGAVRKYLQNDRDAYAGGGIVDAMTRTVQEKFGTGMQMTSGLRYTDNGLHSKGQAADFSNGGDAGTPEMKGLAAWIRQNFLSSTLQLIHNPFGGNILNKQDVGDGYGSPGYGAGTMEGHRNHVHWGVDALVNGDGTTEADPSLWQSFTGALRKGAAWTFDKLISPIDLLVDKATSTGFGGGILNDLPKKMYDKIKGAVRSFIVGKDGDGGPAGGGTIAPGTGPVQDQVREAFAAYGWDQGAQWDAVLQLVNGESSWNPTIRNPSSGAYGLFQFLGSTKDQYLPDENPNPKIQGDAGARYIRDRYGDPLGAWNFWQNQSPHWYDNGGILQPGTTLTQNDTGKPEYVFTTPQWDVLKQGLNWEGANKYVADNSKGWQDAGRSWAVDAFKEITGGFTSELGIDGIINKAVDEAVSREAQNRANYEQAVASGTIEPNKVADTMNFFGVDANKAVDEMVRAASVGMGPSNGRYRGEN